MCVFVSKVEVASINDDDHHHHVHITMMTIIMNPDCVHPFNEPYFMPCYLSPVVS